MRRQSRVSVRTVLAIGLLAGACAGEAHEEDRLTELRTARHQLVLQYMSAQNSIRRVQAQALDEEGVRAAQDSFEASFRAAVERDDPESLELLERAEEVGRQVEIASQPAIVVPGDDSPPPTYEERVETVAELADVERRLRPVTDRAFQDPEVRARFQLLRDSLVAAMVRIEPAAQASLDQMDGIEQQILEIDQEMERLEND